MADEMVIFGGTFDPVHNGHLLTALALVRVGGFAKVTFMPTARPPHKSAAFATPQQRLEMLKLAVADQPAFEVSDIELLREGPSYTIDTITELRRRIGDERQICLVVGQDMLADLPRWRRAEEVIRSARIITVCRPPWHDRLDTILAGIAERFGSQQAERIRQDIVNTELIDISSTMVRQRVKAGQPIGDIVPAAVERYIRDNGLYLK